MFKNTTYLQTNFQISKTLSIYERFLKQFHILCKNRGYLGKLCYGQKKQVGCCTNNKYSNCRF